MDKGVGAREKLNDFSNKIENINERKMKRKKEE